MGRRYQANSYNQSHRDNDSQIRQPLFSSSFPEPPRRQASTLNDVAFDEESGATFRHADSTNRALAALAQAKYEQMERRRAATLLSVLAVTAILFHGLSAGYLQSAASGLMELRPTLPNSNVGRGIQRGKTGDAVANVKNTTDEGAEERLKEEKFLSQFSGLLDSSFSRTPEERPLFWHVPRAGGTSIKNAMGQCLGLVSASEGGAPLEPGKFDIS